MNLQYERLQSLCQHLRLTAIPHAYLEVGQKNAEASYSHADF